MAGRPLIRARRQGKTPGSGRQKGVPNKKKNAAELLEEIKRELRRAHLLEWPNDWEPVARMALLAEKHFSSDPYLALAALKEVAQYLRPKLQSVKIEAEVEHKHTDMSAIGRKFDDLMRQGREREQAAIGDGRETVINGEATEVKDLEYSPTSPSD